MDNEEFMKDINSLMEGTEAHLVSDSSSAVMHDRPKIPTPIPQLNCIFGGGLPLGIIVEAFGEPSSGKSSTMYQTLGNFQKKFPEGIGIIVDTEASVDRERMPFMGCDPDKILRIPAGSVESGFNQVFKILDNKSKNEELKKLPVFILWDTIGINATQKQLDTGDQFSGGMLEKAKTIKFELSRLLPIIEEQPIIVVLLNQVTTKMGRFGSSLTSGGGWGIKHNAHLRIRYNSGKTEYNGPYAVSKTSTLDLVKSKISAQFEHVNIVLDITKGGIVDPVRSFLDYCRDQLGYFKIAAWSKMDPIKDRHPEYHKYLGDFFNKSFRYNDLVKYSEEHKEMILFLELLFTEDIQNMYSYQAEVCEPYKEEIVKELNSLTIDKDKTDNNDIDKSEEKDNVEN